MRLIALLFVLLAACASLPSTHFSSALDSTVYLETSDGSGTGVVISDHCVLTVQHVADQPTIQATTHAQHTVTMNVVATDVARDIAVACSSDTLVATVARLARKAPDLYAPLFTIGYPLAFREFLTQGLYEGSDKMSVPTAPGNSGGGVWDDSGRVVGLVDAIAVYPINGHAAAFPHLAMMVTIADIRDFLDTNHIAYQE